MILGWRSLVFPVVVVLANCLVLILLKFDGESPYFLLELVLLSLAGFFSGGWLDKREKVKRNFLGRVNSIEPFNQEPL